MDGNGWGTITTLAALRTDVQQGEETKKARLLLPFRCLALFVMSGKLWTTHTSSQPHAVDLLFKPP